MTSNTGDRICTRCHESKLATDFYNKSDKPGKRAYCKRCWKEISLDYKHAAGINLPMSISKESSTYLGVYIAESVLANVFDNVIRMPVGHPGYDFICGKGFKIDAKSSKLYIDPSKRRSSRWMFSIGRNTKADYFICLGFNNDRKNVTPLRMWLIPAKEVNMLQTLSIRNNDVVSWKQYEKSTRKVLACCEHMRIKA